MRKIVLVFVALAAALPALAAADARSGFITTRPKCAPPGYTQEALNYLQGPEPILLDSGDLTMLVGTGKCCTVSHWEGLFSLTYPAAGRAAVPRFHPLWATNDFSRVRSRKEAEIGFPSALWWNGKWRIALTTTFQPSHKPDRDRLGRIDLPDLVTRATTAQVVNNWVQPADPRCRGLVSCPGDGSGLDPVLTLHPNGDLYVYHRDGNYPACSSGYVRHRVASDMSVVAANVDGCVRFDGLAKTPFLVSDIARNQDGTMSLLAASTTSLAQIEEWTSSGDAAHIGLLWTKSGRRWTAPPHPTAGWTYFVRDAAFVKDDSRNIVTPTAVVAQISDGRNYAELTDAALGHWYLYYWAEDGAPLPASFGSAADACAYQGTVESADCTKVRGWAWDPQFPTSPVSVDILADGKLVQTIAADQLRPDLHRGDNRHGFEWAIPPALHDGRSHRYTARFNETPDPLAGKAAQLICP
jgi:hypothetical protein